VIDERIILKWLFRKEWGVWTELSGSRQRGDGRRALIKAMTNIRL
jgi:hypothetical protein